jgi:tellurite resistance protein
MKNIFRSILRIIRDTSGWIGHSEHVNLFSVPFTNHQFVLFQLIQRTMILLMSADGKIEPDEISAAVKLFKRVTGDELNLRDFYDEIETIDLWIKKYWRSLEQAKDCLSRHEIELVLTVAIMVAVADCEFDAGGMEICAVETIAEKLGYKHLNELICTLVHEARPL